MDNGKGKGTMRNLIKAGIAVLVLSLNLAAPAEAGPFEDASAAYERGDYATALRLWRPLADQGDAASNPCSAPCTRKARACRTTTPRR
jgi:TPR repeat protein